MFRLPGLEICGLMLLLTGLGHAGDLSAHTRSESFSRWQYSGQTLSLRFTVSAREATRLPNAEGEGLEDALANYLESHIFVHASDADCTRSGALQPLTARPGFLQIEAIWHCSKAPSALGINAFFDLAAEHSHFASYESPLGLNQRLITGDDPLWMLGTEADDDRVSSAGSSRFTDYVMHGFRHITSGFDHVLFLIALLFICRRTRDIIWAITGFTLGHSITLSVAVMGLVQVDISSMEAIIGLTIGLVAVERTAASMNSALPLATVSALLLLLMLPLTSIFGGTLGMSTVGGLALFSFCYLLAAHDLGGRGSFRVLVTTLFGLAHGFGFAGAFLANGAGVSVVPWSLAGFNIGVELGQLALLACMLTVGLLFRRLLFRGRAHFAAPAGDLVTAVICGFGVFWFVQRSFS